MSRLAPPLVLLAALVAGRAHAQAGDRYGPGPAIVTPASYGPAAAPTLRPAPALRTLSWPGKAELRPALAPAPALAPPMAASAPTRGLAATAPNARFPSMSAYAAPVPALRTEGAGWANTPSRSSTWPAPTRTPRQAAAAHAPATYASARPPVWTPRPGPATAPPEFAPTIARQPSASTLPAGLAAPPAYVAPGPAYGPALAAQARQQAQAAAAPMADTLPPPTVGRYGYVGPGRTAPAPASVTPMATVAAAPPASNSAAGGLGPPRPPAYARGYVLPHKTSLPQADPSASPPPAGAAATAAMLRAGDGGRRYSVHREYGMEPDPAPVPPQFFANTADLSTPDPAAVAGRTKGAVNAARLAGSEP